MKKIGRIILCGVAGAVIGGIFKDYPIWVTVILSFAAGFAISNL